MAKGGERDGEERVHGGVRAHLRERARGQDFFHRGVASDALRKVASVGRGDERVGGDDGDIGGDREGFSAITELVDDDAAGGRVRRGGDALVFWDKDVERRAEHGSERGDARGPRRVSRSHRGGV